MTLKVKIIT